MVTIAYILCLFVTGAVPLVAQKPADPNMFNCSVKGTVTDLSTGQPLRKAYVRLEMTSGAAVAYPAVTDPEGKFKIESVAPGDYRLVAEKPGFLDGRYGGLSAGVELRLSLGESISGLDISLTPQATISGRVVDEDGDPWAHGVVNIYRSVWKRDKRELAGFKSQDLDDHGTFRVGDLPPGRYYVAAIPDDSWENRNRLASAPHNQLTWYPSSAGAEAAVAIVLTAGEDRNGIDIQLRRTAFYHIRGKVTGLDQLPSRNEPEPFSRPRVSAKYISDLLKDAPSYSGTLRPDGSFEFPAVPTGAYEVHVAIGFLSAVTLGHTTVRIDDHDIGNVSIDLVQPRPLKGRVQVESGEPFDPTGLSIWLDSADGASIFRPAAVRKDGSFDFPEVPSETYRVRLSGRSAGLVYLKKLRYGDTESLNGTFSNASDSALTLILSMHGARLTGKVNKSSDSRTAPKVVLIPDAAKIAAREDGTRIAVFDQYGVFSIDSIAPGAYHLYAFENVPEDSWEDPDLLREIADKGVALRFLEGDFESIQLAAIPRADLAGPLAKLGIE